MPTTARVFTELKKGHIIQKSLKDTNRVVYGARAMNVQLPLPYQRYTEDYDIYSRNPRRSARMLEKELDSQAKGDFFYVKQAQHPGTWKVMDTGADYKKGTKDDYGVADYTKPKRKIKKVKVRGINYAHLSEREKDAKRALKDPQFKFRHHKDRGDLWRIKMGRKLRRFL